MTRETAPALNRSQARKSYLGDGRGNQLFVLSKELVLSECLGGSVFRTLPGNSSPSKPPRYHQHFNAASISAWDLTS